MHHMAAAARGPCALCWLTLIASARCADQSKALAAAAYGPHADETRHIYRKIEWLRMNHFMMGRPKDPEGHGGSQGWGGRKFCTQPLPSDGADDG